MSNALAAVSLLLDITTALTHLTGEANKLARTLKENEGQPLTDAQWDALLDEATRTEIQLIAAVARRRERENAK